MAGEDAPNGESAGQDTNVFEQLPMGGFNTYDPEKFKRWVSLHVKRRHAQKIAEYQYLNYSLQSTMRGTILQQHIDEAACQLRAMMHHEDIEHHAPIVSVIYAGAIERSAGGIQTRDGRMTCIPGRAFIQAESPIEDGENQQVGGYQFVIEMPRRTMTLSFASVDNQAARAFHNILVLNIAAHHESISGGVHSAIYQWNRLEKEKRKSAPRVGIISEISR